MTLHVLRLPFTLDPLIAEAKRRMRRRRFLVLTLLLVVAGVAVGVTFGLRSGGGGSSGAFNGLGRTQRPRTAADVLGPKTLTEVEKYNAEMAKIRKRQNAYATAHGLNPQKPELVLPDTARLLGLVPNYNRIYAAADTQGGLCLIVQNVGPTCSLPLSRAHPVITRPPAWTPSAGGALTSFSLAMDGITAVSFKSRGREVTVPVKDNLWYYAGPNQANNSLIAHLANGHDERIYRDCAQWSVVGGHVRSGPACFSG